MLQFEEQRRQEGGVIEEVGAEESTAEKANDEKGLSHEAKTYLSNPSAWGDDDGIP